MLAYVDERSGPPVVPLHAGVADGRVWAPQDAELRTRCRMVRPDLGRFGASPLPHEPFSHATDVVAMLDHLGVGAASFVGSSFGGQVALELAVAESERVSSLLLLWR